MAILGVPWALRGSWELQGKCWKEWLPIPPDLRPFLLEGVTSPGPSDPGIATRCHPQLILEMKAEQKGKEPDGKKGETPLQGVSDLERAQGCWGGC